MRQEFLNQLERTLAAIMAASKVEGVEIPALTHARETATAAIRQHKRMREGVERYTEQARHSRRMVNLLRALDALYMAYPNEGDDEPGREEFTEEHLNRI